MNLDLKKLRLIAERAPSTESLLSYENWEDQLAFIDAFRTATILALLDRLEAAEAQTKNEVISEKAREWEAHYPVGSDGRNTFVLFAEWIENRAAMMVDVGD